MSYHTYWGDMHAQFHPIRNPDADWETVLQRAYTAAREHLDFAAIIYYPALFFKTPEGLHTESIGMKDSFEAEWAVLKRLAREYHAPGRFVPICGYEWTGDRERWGDHNVFFPQDDPPLLLDRHIDDLCAQLRRLGALAIPHHVGYRIGSRGKNWDHWDAEVSPFAEVYSCHGSSEGPNTPLPLGNNGSMSPGVSGSTWQDGLARGYRVGAIASTDHFAFAGSWGSGLVAVQATELSREALWEAFRARRVYGVTGDRIQLHYTLNDAYMGSIVTASAPVTLHAAVTCTQALDRIEVIKNNRVIYTHCHNGAWDVPTSGIVRAKVAFEFGWGPAHSAGVQTSDKRWEVRLLTPGATICSVEGRCTQYDDQIEPVSDTECRFSFTTKQREYALQKTTQRGIVFEIEAPIDQKLTLEADHYTMEFTLAEAMREVGLLVYHDEAVQLIQNQFGLGPDDLENPGDSYYHHAYKVKRYLAAPAIGYTKQIELTDTPAPGRNWYYLRISQLNGQYAWSSPIWVDNGV